MNQWFNVDACAIASSQTGVIDYMRKTASPINNDSMIKAAMYFNK
jgi:hypothetical protein